MSTGTETESGKVRIEDEEGGKWVVRKGDPAHEKVGELRRLGFRWIVLNQLVLTGSVEETEIEYIPIDMEKEKVEERAIRHNDCLLALGVGYKAEGMR